jgi:hypothetical protein
MRTISIMLFGERHLGPDARLSCSGREELFSEGMNSVHSGLGREVRAQTTMVQKKKPM